MTCLWPQAEPNYMTIARAILIGVLMTAMSLGLDWLGGFPLDHWTVFSFSAGGFWLGSKFPRWPRDGGD